MHDPVKNPQHYMAEGFCPGCGRRYEAMEVIEGFGLDKDWHLGNAAKYLLRAGKKGPMIEDLRKLVQYVERKIELLSS